MNDISYLFMQPVNMCVSTELFLVIATRHSSIKPDESTNTLYNQQKALVLKNVL